MAFQALQLLVKCMLVKGHLPSVGSPHPYDVPAQQAIKHMEFLAGILCGSWSGLRHGALAARAHGQPEELPPAGGC